MLYPPSSFHCKDGFSGPKSCNKTLLNAIFSNTSLLYLLTYMPKKAKPFLHFAFEMSTQQGVEFVCDNVVESTADGGCAGRISAELN